MIVFFITYFLLLFFASFIILGWYKISREGMLFEFWSKFWEAKKGTEKVPVEGEKLYKEYREIEKAALLNGYKGTLKYTENYLEADRTFEQFKSRIEHHLQIHLSVITIGEKANVFLEEEKLIFKFSDYIRNPVSSCPVCMSSIYGSTIFWSFIALVNIDLFSWTDSKTIALILTWIAFEFSLAFINTFIHEKMEQEEE